MLLVVLWSVESACVQCDNVACCSVVSRIACVQCDHVACCSVVSRIACVQCDHVACCSVVCITHMCAM